MALQTTGPISLRDIYDEFYNDGDLPSSRQSYPINISEYYGADSNVPSSGQISIGDFYGANYFPPFYF